MSLFNKKSLSSSSLSSSSSSSSSGYSAVNNALNNSTMRERLEQDAGFKISIPQLYSSKKKKYSSINVPSMKGTGWETALDLILDDFNPKVLCLLDAIIEEPISNSETLDKKIKVTMEELETLIRSYHEESLQAKIKLKSQTE